jgi:amino acid transporter
MARARPAPLLPTLTPTTSALAANRLGTGAVVLFVMSAIAPFVVQGGIVPAALAVTGLIGVPVAFLAVAGVLALFSPGYVAMARHVANAGSFYTYIARGLGKPAGVAAAWVALLAYNPFQIGAAGAFGAFAAPLVAGWFGVGLPWWVLSLAAWALVTMLGVRSIDLSGKVVGALILAEIATIVVLSVAGLLTSDVPLSAAPLDPGHLVGPGAGTLAVLALTGFAGWEQSVVFSEEVRDPKRTVPRATYLSLALIAALYGFASWAMIVAGGVDGIVGRAQAEGPELLFTLAGESLGPAAVTFGRVLLLTSLFAAMVAFHNIIARIAFALGREGVLPKAFGRTSAGAGAPKYGSLAQSGLALVMLAGYVVAGYGFGGRDNPVVHLFYWGGATGAVGILLLITATAFAIPIFFARNHNTETAWRRRIAPLAALVLLLTLTVLALGNLDVLLGVPPGSTLTRAVPLAYAAVAVAGASWALWLRVRQPSVYAAIGLGAKAATAPAVPAPRTPAHSAAITRKETSIR